MISLRAPSRAQLATALAVVIGLAAIVGIVSSFGQELTSARENRTEIARLEQAIDEEQARIRGLTERLEYVQSDVFLEQWARESMKLGRPDDIVVIPVDDVDEIATPAPEQAPAPVAEAEPAWVEMWELVFNSTEE